MAEYQIDKSRASEHSLQKATNISPLFINISQLERSPFPNFRRPTEVAVFSTAVNNSTPEEVSVSKKKREQYCIVKDPSALQRKLANEKLLHRAVLYVEACKSGSVYDLNSGYDSYIPKQNQEEYLDLLLLSLQQDNLIGQQDFVSWRGLLTKIAASPYENGKFDTGLMVVAQKLNGTIYLRDWPTDAADAEEANRSDRQKLMTYWGHKFETYLIAKPGSVPHPQEPVNLNNEFCSVVRTKLNDLTLLFGGEVDCCLHDRPNHYIELKTTRVIEHRGQESSFRRFKLMKWWLQSFLIGIEDVVCGYRDDEGFIRDFERMKVSQMPDQAKKERNHWKPVVCFAFLEEFLHFIKNVVDEDLVPFVFERNPNTMQFTVRKDMEGKMKFLPSWFVIPDSSNSL